MKPQWKSDPYYGLYKGASDYSDRTEVINDILHLIKEILRLLKEYFKDKWNQELEERYKRVEEILKDL